MKAIMKHDAHRSKKICLASKCFTLLIDDLIFEILSWLPAKCLTRCMVLSKFWCMIIKSRKFVEKHMQRAKPFRHYEIPVSSPPSENPFIFCYTIDGLILERSLDYCRIRNPTINWDLQVRRFGYIGGLMSMSYLPSIEKYKLSSVKVNGDRTSIWLHVLTVGVDDKWKIVMVPFSCSNKRPIYCATLDGVSYMLRCCFKSCCEPQIFVFEIEDERFVRTSMPQGFEVVCRNWSKFPVIKWDNKFGICCMVEGVFHIWILQDYKKAEWEERKIVLCPSVVEEYPHIKNYFPYEVERSKLFMISSDSSMLLCYDFKSKQHLWNLGMFERVATSLVRLT